MLLLILMQPYIATLFKHQLIELFDFFTFKFLTTSNYMYSLLAYQYYNNQHLPYNAKELFYRQEKTWTACC